MMINVDKLEGKLAALKFCLLYGSRERAMNYPDEDSRFSGHYPRHTQ
jgi:hypothetical protein